MKHFFKKLLNKLQPHVQQKEKTFFLSLVGKLSKPATSPDDLMHFCAIYLCAQTFTPQQVSTKDIKTMWLGTDKDNAKKAFVFHNTYIVFIGEQNVYQTNVSKCPFRKNA